MSIEKEIYLGDTVSLFYSGETGAVIGLARYLHSEDQALVRYKCADGRLIESWWGFSAIRVSAIKVTG